MKFTRRTLAVVMILAMLLTGAVAASAAQTEQVHTIVLDYTVSGEQYTHTATLNGDAVPEYDYIWHADPSKDHGQVKNSPAEYYTGIQPSGGRCSLYFP